MIVAVVGNGPSAVGQGKLIDKCDFVVRCTTFPAVFPNGEAGGKLDAWAWYGHYKIVDAIGRELPRGSYQHWHTLPLTRCCPPNEGHLGDPLNIIRLMGTRTLRAVTEDRWARQASYISIESQSMDWAAPTTGFTAIDMAIEHMPYMKELHLFGFDATRPENSGWGDARETALKWPEKFGGDGHDHETEKMLLGRLRDDAIWLGSDLRPLDIEVVWHDAPEVQA